MLKDYIKKYCNNCKNKNSNLCKIAKDLEGNWKCAEFKESMMNIKQNNARLKLIKLLDENPDLPIILKVYNDELTDDYVTIYRYILPHKEKVMSCETNGKTFYEESKENLIKDVYNELDGNEEYIDLSQDEYEEAIKKYIDKNAKSYEAIIIEGRFW